MKGQHGIEQEVFLSIPAVLCRHGVVSVVSQPLDSAEVEQLKNSAKAMHEIQKDLKL